MSHPLPDYLHILEEDVMVAVTTAVATTYHPNPQNLSANLITNINAYKQLAFRRLHIHYMITCRQSGHNIYKRSIHSWTQTSLTSPDPPQNTCT